MKDLALRILRGYKRWISPAFPPSCRYVPTCSEYAMEAVDRYGVGCGGSMALWRVLRCHPLASGGLDPVVKQSLVDDPTLPQGTREDGTPDRTHDQTDECVHPYVGCANDKEMSH